MNPEDIVIVHVGGSGDYGPVGQVMTLYPLRSVVYAIEAREVPADQAVVEEYRRTGARVELVNACVWRWAGKYNLFVTPGPQATSLCHPSGDMAGDYINAHEDGPPLTWGQVTGNPERRVVDTVTLADICKSRGIEPDVVSLDAQGAELGILEGLGERITRVGAVVTEVNFARLYSGQGLFHQQAAFLHDHGFRLAALLNPQFWHPGPAAGKGFLTVAEALWFRDMRSFFALPYWTIARGVKLAAVAFSFDRWSYAYSLLKELLAMEPAAVERICQGFPNLMDLVRGIDDHLEEYQQDGSWFFKHLYWAVSWPDRKEG